MKTRQSSSALSAPRMHPLMIVFSIATTETDGVADGVLVAASQRGGWASSWARPSTVNVSSSHTCAWLFVEVSLLMRVCVECVVQS